MKQNQELVLELARLRKANARLRKQNAALEAESLTDQLTGLWNRRYGSKELEKLLSSNRRATKRRDRRSRAVPYSVLMLDIDYFKRINDTLGHAVGDRVLRALADIMRETCRATDTLVRWGGEEFLVVCRSTTQKDVLALARRLRLAVQASSVGLEVGMTWPLTVSVGVSQFSSFDDSYEVAVQQADEALYAAKHAGRNRVSQFYAEAAA